MYWKYSFNTNSKRKFTDCYGFVDRNVKKIETLKLLIKEFYNSFYTDDALFELAMTLSFETKYDESITYYDKILNS